MSCTSYGGVIVCQPTRGGARQRQIGKCYGKCPKGWQSRIVRMERSPWYGPDFHCLECGDSWDMEGVFSRPERKGWRKGAKARFRLTWQDACWCPVERDGEHYALPCQLHPTGDAENLEAAP
ncbi:uncharacterized protein RMCC_2472 [Mycolicibacterium canariasense]|uniref:Uncharacterized protein n=1 Tax=Mycolicibacterium canariasense TaxID=228230 RepID=A0A100WCJ3_MYCCR|nr:uncharacterized protein RMCC_2472 [Mycolicibacterium canariasense]